MPNIGVTIDGVNLSAYAEEIQRESHLCQPDHLFHLRMSASTPRTALLPWKPVVLSEEGTTVLTGYLQKIEFSRPPAHIMLHGNDTWKRATDWFIAEPLVSAGETVSFWANYLCGVCGLSYVITATSGASNVVLDGLPLGLRHVSESLLVICAFAQWCVRVRPDGVVDFRTTTRSSVADYDITHIMMKVEDDTNDESTRNAVKVFGSSGSGGGLVYSATRAVTGVPDSRIMVFGDPNLDPVKGALLGEAALDQFADLERRSFINIHGNPNIQVGQTAKLFMTGGSTAYRLNLITDMKSSIDVHGGYEQSLTVGRRCFRLPAFGVYGPGNMPSPPPTSGSTLLNGLIAYWKMDETSGSRASSVVSYLAPGTVYNLYVAGLGSSNLPSTTGKISMGTWFEDPNFPAHGFRELRTDTVADPSDVLSFYNTDRTVALWIRLDDKTTDHWIISRYTRVAFGNVLAEWAIFYQQSSDRFVFRYGGDLVANALGSPGLGVWYFIVCTRENGVGKVIRINDTYVDTAAYLLAGGNDPFNRFQIGAFFNGITFTDQLYWQGVIDEGGIWGRVLNATEQTDLFNSGKGRQYPFP